MAYMTNAQLLQLVADLRSELDTLRADLASARREAEFARSSARSELDAFKAQVREVALEAKKENNWCDDGFNSVMQELELEPLPHTIVIEIEVRATQTVTVELTSNDLDEMTEEAAREHIEGGNVDFSDLITSYNWEYEDVEEGDIKSIEVQTD
jgi:multidrug efflux pump subunit AcrA (membrane-fusion protein)